MKTSLHTESNHALITGASKGLGLALARELGKRGVRLSLVARNRDALDSAVAALRQSGIEALGIVADIGDSRAAARVLGESQTALGPIDLVIHNASTLGPVPMRPLSELEAEELGEILRVGVLGPHRINQQVAGSMVLRGRGTIVTISSDAAVNAYPTWGGYSAAKIAADHLSRIWAAELEGSGVRFFAIDPGEMDTEMHAAAIPDADPSQLANPAHVAVQIADLLQASSTVSGKRYLAAEAEVQP